MLCLRVSDNALGNFVRGHTDRYFIITNRLGTNGFNRGDWLRDVQGDLWMSHNQTTGWKLVAPGFIGRSSSTHKKTASTSPVHWPCPPDFPFPATSTPFICYNESVYAHADSGPCLSWCTDCPVVGDQPEWCNNGVRPLCSGHSTVRACPTTPPSSGAWDSGYTYVTGQSGFALTATDPLYGAYMGGQGRLPGAGPIHIGVYTLRVVP